MKVFIVITLLVAGSLCEPSEEKVNNKAIVTNEKHVEEEEHNSEYDHEAFLGKQEAHLFDELTPEESKERLG